MRLCAVIFRTVPQRTCSAGLRHLTAAGAVQGRAVDAVPADGDVDYLLRHGHRPRPRTRHEAVPPAAGHLPW